VVTVCNGIYNNAAPTTCVPSGAPSAGTIIFGAITTSTPEFAVVPANQSIPNCGATLDVGEKCAIGVTYTASALGTQTGTLFVASNSSTSPQSVSLSGTSLAGLVNLSAKMSWGNTEVGSTSGVTKTATLTNPNSVAMTVYSVTATGNFATTSIGANPCNLAGSTILAANDSCTVGVTFTPSAQGTDTGSLSITSNARNATVSSPGTIALQGTGTLSAPVFSPTSLQFGKVTMSTTSAPKLVTLTNNDALALTVSSITSNNADYAVSGTSGGATCGATPITIGSASSCSVSVTFTPSVIGADNGKISFVDNAGSGAPLTTQTVAVYGSGG